MRTTIVRQSLYTARGRRSARPFEFLPRSLRLHVYAKLTILDLKTAHRKHHPREQRDGDDPDKATGEVPLP